MKSVVISVLCSAARRTRRSRAAVAGSPGRGLRARVLVPPGDPAGALATARTAAAPSTAGMLVATRLRAAIRCHLVRRRGRQRRRPGRAEGECGHVQAAGRAVAAHTAPRVGLGGIPHFNFHSPRQGLQIYDALRRQLEVLLRPGVGALLRLLGLDSPLFSGLLSGVSSSGPGGRYGH